MLAGKDPGRILSRLAQVILHIVPAVTVSRVVNYDAFDIFLKHVKGNAARHVRFEHFLDDGRGRAVASVALDRVKLILGMAVKAGWLARNSPSITLFARVEDMARPLPASNEKTRCAVHVGAFLGL
ncbi:hypothetical protein [Roseovarius marisflavi]|uniref:hypothetical protein n=1 Tax=Roseovarius marisflavi TaxID=1054996 RepID=UPI0009334F7B|nr:hypothetical protein [Roseovarius marisflavi]